MKIYESAEELIGKTPLLRLKNIEKQFDVKAKFTQSLNISTQLGQPRTEPQNIC